VSYRVELRPEVLDDLREASRWYEGEQEGLGQRLQQTFFSAVSVAAQNPEIFFKAYAEFRRVLLRHFPYVLYFSVHEDAVVFVLLFHGARDPQELRKALQGRSGRQ
jgi:plasmid stabilization system protein ParE